MTATEDQLQAWTAQSSPTEQEKQERTERMIRDAVADHPAFAGCRLAVYAKGSYANDTNVRVDSDVDISVECLDVTYWEESEPGAHAGGTPVAYTGAWSPARLRSELESALRAKFGSQVDASGQTAFQVRSSSARIDADVVPCFTYEYHMPYSKIVGTRLFKKSGGTIDNYPEQHLSEGQRKDLLTRGRYKPTVRILKRVENLMVSGSSHPPVPSFLVESLVWNCPNSTFLQNTWCDIVREVLRSMWARVEDVHEPTVESDRLLEANGIKFLFHHAQKWTRPEARAFVLAAWNYLDLAP